MKNSCFVGLSKSGICICAVQDMVDSRVDPQMQDCDIQYCIEDRDLVKTDFLF